MTPFGSHLASMTAIDGDRSSPSRGSGGRSCRWGDYAGASTDPSHADDVWGSNQVNGPQPSSPRAQWATQNFDLTPTGATGPTASFTANPSLVSPGTPVNFDGGGSTGTGLTYTRNFGDGTAPTTTGPTTSHPYTTPGVYPATLTVPA